MTISRQPIISSRIRRIDGQGFCFVPHRFLRDGFLASINRDEQRVYVFLVLAGDRRGVSYYHYDSMCSILQLTVEEYVEARNGLIRKDLIAFDGTRFQVLSLPPRPVVKLSRALETELDFEREDPATIGLTVKQAFETEV